MPIKEPPVAPPRRHPSASLEPSPVPKVVVSFFAALRKIFRRAEDERRVVHDDQGVAHEGRWRVRIATKRDDIDGGFVAECLDVPGAMAQGETEEEAIENLIDAIQGVVQVKIEEHFAALDHGPVSTGRTLTVQF